MDIHKLYVFFSHVRTKRLKNYCMGDSKLIKIPSVLDLGGSLYWWELARKMGMPVPDVTILNLYQGPENLPSGIKWVVGTGKTFRSMTTLLTWCSAIR